ncbi:MAG: site-specific integrase [Tannerellaceae bacterium]|nr:site-specific integrase [Tannerellaceae bacterium]
MYIKRRIKFVLHTRKKGDSVDGKNLAIRMRVSYSGNTPLDFSIGHTTDARYWDPEKECVIKGSLNRSGQTSYTINKTIDEYRSYMEEIFARYELLEKRIPEPDEVKNLFYAMTGRSIAGLSDLKENFFDVFDRFTQEIGEKNQWTSSTYENFAALKNHFLMFDPKITFRTVDNDKMQQYVIYLTNKGFRNTTIAKNLAFVRWFFRWAANKGYYSGTIHHTFKPKLKGVDGNSKEIVYLTQQEIRLLQNYKFQSYEAALERVCDVFLFTCFTGLRYSDVAKLKRSDIKDGFIQVVTQKTVDGLIIELNKHSQAILDKYKNVTFPNDKALPVVSNEKMNEHLKRLGQVCGIEEPQRVVYFKGSIRYEEVYPKWALLTTHCGRRTFVVTALQLGIPAEIIIRWTGHSDYKSMKPYVKIVDELKERSMARFNDL